REIVRRFNTNFGLEISESLWGDAVALGRVTKRIPGLEKPGEDAQGGEARARDALAQSIRRAVFEWGWDNFREKMASDACFFSLPEVLQEPDVILTETPRVPGTDGRRMAKSYGNAIWLSDTPEEIRAKTRNMMTDPQRVRRTDPGRPEVCPVFAYHNLFPEKKSADDCARIERVDRECRTAAIGCVDCKKLMADALVKWIEPIQARRAKYEASPREVWDVLEDGSHRAKKVAERTMERVRKAVFNWEGAGRSGAASGEGKGKVATEK
ncbi:MAG: hypothetical protein WA855_14200, partial [Candidatus Acidiferrales bacterium]